MEFASEMPPTLVADTHRGAPRRWQLDDMVSRVDEGKAKVIGVGDVGEEELRYQGV